MDWLRLERRIRDVLEEYNTGAIPARGALIDIANILGEETGRGYIEIAD